MAVLGFATRCSHSNQAIAYKVGRELALNQFTVCAGNVTGTFIYAFNGAKSTSGHTLAVVEADCKGLDKPHCDEVVYAPNSDKKHQLIADKCQGAIVIGGGPGTKKLISHFLNMDKPVVAIMGSGGVVTSELDQRVKVIDKSCLDNIVEHIQWVA